MSAPKPQPRPTTTWIWMLFTAVLVLVTVLVGLMVLQTIFTGETELNVKNAPKRIFTFAKDPGSYLLALATQFVIFGGLCLASWVRIDTWRARKTDPRALERELAGIEKSTSKAGNKAALILSVPFIFIALLAVYAIVFGSR